MWQSQLDCQPSTAGVHAFHGLMRQDCLHRSRRSAGRGNYLHHAFTSPLSMQHWRSWGGGCWDETIMIRPVTICLFMEVCLHVCCSILQRENRLFMLVRLLSDSHLPSSPHFDLFCSSFYLLLSFMTLLYLAVSKLVAAGERGKESQCLTSSDKKRVWILFFNLFFFFPSRFSFRSQYMGEEAGWTASGNGVK